MKKITTLFSLAVLIVLACNANKDTGTNNVKPVQVTDTSIVQDTIKKSIPAEVKATVDGADIKIKYHSPGVKGRIIWGGLVPYNEVWVTGAHMATSIDISRGFEISGKKIAAGKYAFFTIPGKEEWIVIINKNWNQHLSDEYDEKEDVIRLKMKPQVNEQHVERLKYSIDESRNSEATISMNWEKLKISFPLTIK